MKVSILIPTLNRLAFLKESLDSVRRQTHSDLEILISDDGSKDGTVEYVKTVQAADPRVRLVSPNPKPGLFSNINHLLKEVRGDFFCILADDDRALPDYVKKLTEPFLKDPSVAVTFCDHWMIDGHGDRLPKVSEQNSVDYGRDKMPEGNVEKTLLLVIKRSICLGFTFFRSDFFKGELFDVDCGGAADMDYEIKAASKGKFYYVKERLGEYREHPGTATLTKEAYMFDGMITVLNKHIFPDPSLEAARKESLRDKYRLRAVRESTENPRLCFQSYRDFIRLGGFPADPRILLALGLALFPRNFSLGIKSFFKNLRHGIEKISGTDSPHRTAS